MEERAKQNVMPKQQLYLPFKKLFIELHMEDQCAQGSNTFHTLPEFKQFLLDNPEILKALRTGKLDNGVVISGDADLELETRI